MDRFEFEANESAKAIESPALVSSLATEDFMRLAPLPEKNGHDTSEGYLPGLDLFDDLNLGDMGASSKVSLTPEQRESYLNNAKNIVDMLNSNKQFMKSILQNGMRDGVDARYIDLAYVEDMISKEKNLTPEQVQFLGFVERYKNELKDMDTNDLPGSKVSLRDISALKVKLTNPNLSDAGTTKLLDEMYNMWGARNEYARLQELPDAALSLWGEKGDPAKAINPDAVQQGGLGDCYFLSLVASMASTDSGRQMLQDMITPVKDQNGALSHYNVQFPGYELPLRVNIPSKAEMALYARENGNGVWVRVLEHAWNQYRNHQDPQRFNKEGKMPTVQGGDDGGYLQDPMKILLSGKTDNWSTSWTRDSTLQKALSDTTNGDTILTVATKGSFANSEQNNSGSSKTSLSSEGIVIYAAHAYSVTGYDPETKEVTVRNPHGSNTRIIDGKRSTVGAEIKMSYNEFEKFYREIGISKVKK